MFSKNPLFRFLKWRARLVGDLHGDVLEIGVGEGENLPYYRNASQIWAIEPDPQRSRRPPAGGYNDNTTHY